MIGILWIDTNHDTVLDITDGGLLPQVLAQHPSTTVPASRLGVVLLHSASAKDNSLSIAEGALFNARMLADSLYGHNDGSKGVHNPALYQGLIAGSIEAVNNKYFGGAAVLSPDQADRRAEGPVGAGHQVHAASGAAADRRKVTLDRSEHISC